MIVQRRVIGRRKGRYALEGRATDTYLKTRRDRRRAEQRMMMCGEDLLAISRAGQHASRRDASFVGSLLLARSNVTRDVLGRKPVRRPVSTLPIHRLGDAGKGLE
jgi:hypothetical protein